MSSSNNIWMNLCVSDTYIRSKNLHPAGLLLASYILKAESHALFVCVPPLHLPPVERNHLTLEQQAAFNPCTSFYMKLCKQKNKWEKVDSPQACLPLCRRAAWSFVYWWLWSRGLYAWSRRNSEGRWSHCSRRNFSTNSGTERKRWQARGTWF